jgi:RNA 2',3'-cyclic 3'-phosphodiesterase
VARDRSARPEAKPLRLFIAVDVPVPVKDALASTVQSVHALVPGARWTRPEGWHVTLKFLGSTWPRLVPVVESAVRQAAGKARAFETRLTAIGAFPSANRARVLWAGLDDPGARFGSLVKHLDDLLVDVVSPEKRAFTPHLTLARIDPPARIAADAPDVLSLNVASGPFAVDRLVLYRSRLSPRGATYEALITAAFGD